MRLIDVDALIEKCGDWYVEEGPEIGFIGTLKGLIDRQPTIQPDTPRVMTLEELADAQKTPVWRETKRAHKDLYNGWMLAYDIQRGQGITGTRQGMTEPNGRVGWCKLDDYGKTWRCWTTKPTNEQREAIPWKE